MNKADEDALVEQCFKSDPDTRNVEESIRLAIRAAVAAERERCAKIADSQAWSHQHIGDIGPEMNSMAIASAIRRGE